MLSSGAPRRAAGKAIAAAIVWTTVGLGVAFAQAAAPPPPPPVWAGSFGAGFAVTSGNADTSSYNLAFNLTHDPDNPHALRADALYLRGSNSGTTNVNRATFGVRDDYSLSDRTALFGQFRHLRDEFKEIEYLLAPTFGVAQKIAVTEKVLLAADVGAGAVIEKNTGLDAQTSGAVNVGESFAYKLTNTATITQSVTGLWKTSDFGDALYTFGAGIAANITPRTTLKIELLELYKSLPPPGVQKQDVSLITSFVYTFEQR
jgi:putative salt-induced outer membrane protein YdiY